MGETSSLLAVAAIFIDLTAMRTVLHIKNTNTCPIFEIRRYKFRFKFSKEN